MDKLSFKTISANSKTVHKEWVVVDADGQILGRMCTKIAKLLRGKYKPDFTPNVDCGDNVIVINADKVKLTGKKLANKHYYKHTGYIGSVKDTTAGKILSGRFPERVIQKAVERMISRNPLGRQMMTKLKVYAGSEHPHTAQNPIVWDFASQNSKNKRSAL